jgi:hypothetical protein
VEKDKATGNSEILIVLATQHIQQHKQMIFETSEAYAVLHQLLVSCDRKCGLSAARKQAVQEQEPDIERGVLHSRRSR